MGRYLYNEHATRLSDDAYAANEYVSKKYESNDD
jgi:hypothetical protein